MKSSFLCLAAIPIFLAISARADDLPKPDSKAAPPSAAPKGLVWKLEGGAVPIYLVGSFHLLRREDLPYPPSIDAAYADSQQVWFEIPPGQMEDPKVVLKMMTSGMLGADKSLKDVIPADVWKKVRDWDGDPTMKLAMSKMRPWMAALTITMVEYQKMGADPNLGLEKTIEKKAKADGKETGGFETADFQLGLFSGLTDAQQADMLAETFSELKESKKMISDMLKSWKEGKVDELAKELDAGFKDYPDMKKLLLTDRNESWVEPIEKLAKGTKKTMILVGAGHLCGPGSVIDLLQKKGWKLRRVTGAGVST